MADRGPVKLDKSTERLFKLYKDTYEKIVKDIALETKAGQIRNAQVLARIKKELEVTGKKLAKSLQKEITQKYYDGANAALQDLRAMGIKVSSSGQEAAINRRAIESLVSDVGGSSADALKAVERNARKVVNRAMRLQLNAIIAQGKLLGDTREAISALVEKELKEKGIGALVDTAGRTWQLDNYSRMLVRTKTVEARNEGLKNRMLENGYDLVQVTDHGTKHKECRRWEGKILSLTGQTTGKLDGGFVVAGTVEEAKAAGLFHPNCKHAINVLNPRIASQTLAYDAKRSIKEGKAIYRKAF